MRIFLVLFLSYSLASCNLSDQGCEEDANAKDGINIKYHSNNTPRLIYELDTCRLNGIDLKFHENGRIKVYGYGKSGREYGHWFFYDESGNFISKHFYQNGDFVYASTPAEEVKYFKNSGKLVSDSFEIDCRKIL